MRSSHLAYGLLGILLASALAAACGSDSQKKTTRGEGGGAGGAAGATMNASGGGEFTPLAGAGGEAPSSGGTPNEAMGGVGGTPGEASGGVAGLGEAGAGGEPPMLPPLPVVNCDTITFKDANLEAAVRDAIDKLGTITPADVANLTDLNAVAYGINELDGIECLTSLVSANFSSGEGTNSIANVAPLAYLSNLKSLDLSDNVVDDLSPLVYLTQLTDLKLNYYALVPDLTPLGQLPSLQNLEIYADTLENPDSLSALHNISSLRANSTFGDIQLIKTLTQLRHLELAYVAIGNQDDLANLTNLTYLDLIDMGMNSASPLATLTELSHLYLNENPIPDLLPLQNLTGLHELGLFGISATTIKPLVDNQGLSSGDTVDLSYVPLVCANEKTNVDALIARQVTVVANPCP